MNYPKIAKKTGKSLEEIKKIVAAIQQLDPKPGSHYSCKSSPVVVLDIVIKLIDGEYVTTLEKDYLPYLKVNSKSLKDFNKETKEFIRAKLISANCYISKLGYTSN